MLGIYFSLKSHRKKSFEVSSISPIPQTRKQRLVWFKWHSPVRHRSRFPSGWDGSRARVLTGVPHRAVSLSAYSSTDDAEKL